MQIVPRRSGLFRKYAAVLFAVGTATVLVGGAIELVFNYRESREATVALQGAEARAAAIRIDEFLSGIRSQVAEVAALPFSASVLRPGERRAEFQRLLKLVTAVSEIRYVDSAGRERLKVSRDEPDEIDSGHVYSRSILVDEARKAGFALSPTYFKAGSEPYVSMAVRERNPTEVTVAELNLKFVADVVARIRVGEAGIVYVIDGAGHLVAHPDLGIVLRKPDLSRSGLFEELRAARTGRDPGGLEIPGLGSSDAIVSTASIPAAAWFVVVEQPRAEVLAPVYGSAARTAVLIGVGLLAALWAGYFLARRMARPIIEVQNAARRMGAGDLATRIDVRTGDEIEELAGEFNRMAERLDEYTGGLERKVDERTTELQDALRLARDAMRARALFLAAASHDLRQPLYAISILADTMAVEALPANARASLAKQREAISVLRGLFDNLLDLSRFDSGEVRLHPRVIALREVLEPIAVEHEVVCRAKGLAWHSEIADVWVKTDPELIRRIAANLLSNAVRYTQRGSVSLVAQSDGAVVRLVVSDTGMGIAPENQARVFDEFVQLDNPSRERERGVGLGLSIVKKISDLLQANLTLDSAAGEGTRISVEIPLAEPSSASVPMIELAEPRMEELAGCRVWAVEDDPLVRDALDSQFAAWGVDHAFALTRGDLEALRDSDGGWPDAVMLDDMLGSGERGLDIAEWLGEFMPKQRIVLITGNVEPSAVQGLSESGFTLLRKPLSSAILAQWLHGAIRSSQPA